MEIENEVYLDGPSFVKLVSGGAKNLKANATIVNNLNVFPIPDGDTGANMSLTISGGLAYLKDENKLFIGKAAKDIADGMLLNARGNSGVILSQFFAGIAKELENKNVANLNELSCALMSGVKSAYDAVINPTEGTILTVAREASEYAASRLSKESTIKSFGDDYIYELKESLKRTPDLLAVLKEAGVIDSGGAGLCYIFEGAKKAYRGEEIAIEDNDEKSNEHVQVDFSKFNENSVMKYGYCTEFLLQLTRSKTNIEEFSINDFIAHLETLGNSIVALQNGSIVKTHIHTMKPGEVFNFAQQYGEFLTLKCENMTLQHHDSVVENNFEEFKETEENKERKKYATVSVANGAGIEEVFKELGCDYIVNGGQQHNPSSGDFIEAFDKVNADNIFVFPNNKNIIMAAKQAASLYTKSNVKVIESKSIGTGYVALTMLSYDSDNVDEIAKEFTDAMEGVINIYITKAIRDAEIDGVSIKTNSYIGFEDKKMLSSLNTNYQTAIDALKKIDVKSHDYIIAIYGKDLKDDEKKAFNSLLKELAPSLEVYEIEGGQEVYDFLLIVQ